MLQTILVDAVRYAHLLSVATGFGAAVFADLTALTRLRRSGLTGETVATLHALHAVIWPALGAMWVTGIALIGIRTGFDLSAFSPKLFAKLVVVTVLTGNAVLIGRLAMPAVVRAGGLSGMTTGDMTAAAMIGGVSTASWLIAMALGSSRFLAAAPAELFLALLPAAYAAALAAALGAVAILRRAAAPLPA